MELIDGKKYRNELLEEYKKIIEKENLNIRLDIIQVGDNAESDVYVRNKIKCASGVGIECILHHLKSDIEEVELFNLIDELNKDDKVTGIILQSPLPSHLNFEEAAGRIFSNKDIDGFTMGNTDRLYHNKDGLVPCTVLGIVKLLEHYKVNLDGSNAVIIGRGDIVGKPLALALTNKNATVTLCHSHTKDLKIYTKMADVLISAVGKKGLITGDMIADGAVVIDVGITVEDGKMYGDVDMTSVSKKASLITPVPGGVGPMTVAMVINNLIEAKRKEGKKNG